MNDETSKNAPLESCSAYLRGIGQPFRALFAESSGLRQSWTGSAWGREVGLDGWFHRASAVRALLAPPALPDQPVFAVVRTGIDCLVVVATPEGYVAGIVDFDLGPTPAAEALWEAVFGVSVPEAA